MSFLYDHVITITRPNVAPVIAGDAGYGALSRENETTIYSGIAAGMRGGTGGAMDQARVPSDSSGRMSPYRFICSPQTIPSGTVKIRDIVTDETGQRYQVVMPLWNGLECNLRCEPLTA